MVSIKLTKEKVVIPQTKFILVVGGWVVKLNSLSVSGSYCGVNIKMLGKYYAKGKDLIA